jgi:hypothetical protein
MTAITKIEVARSQLVTSLDLFTRDKDPISVHCLACGGGEVIEGLAQVNDAAIFATHILETQPAMDRGKIRRLRNIYWNAFKHFFDLRGAPRDDQELLKDFDDTKNDAALFIGWWDYAALQKRCPLLRKSFRFGGTR